MTNHFDSKGGEQNVGQGDHAIGKQVNVTQEVRGDGNIVSGTGDVTVNNHGVPLKPKTVVIGSVLAAAVLGASLVGWHLFAPAGKSASTIGDNAPAIITEKGNVAVTYNTSGVPPEIFAKYVTELAVTDSALASFFKTLEEEQVPLSDLDAKLREIAERYKELLKQMQTIQYPQVLHETQQAVKSQSYATPLSYLEQRLRLRREVGDRLGELATLNNIGAIYQSQGKYSSALVIYERGLAISREIGDKEGEGTTLNNLSQIHAAIGDYGMALEELEQSLHIMQEIGDKAMEGTTLNNIGLIYSAQGDYGTALKYLEQGLVIRRKSGDRRGEAETSWNIGRTYEKQGNLTKAEQYMSRAVQLMEEIGYPKQLQEECRTALEAVRAKIKAR